MRQALTPRWGSLSITQKIMITELNECAKQSTRNIPLTANRKPFQVGLSTFKKICVICFIENPLKMIKNAFYFILKALFILKIFKLLS